jgi:hypothetical protein
LLARLENKKGAPSVIALTNGAPFRLKNPE